MLTHKCGNNYNPVSIMYQPVFLQTRSVTDQEKKITRLTCCIRYW